MRAGHPCSQELLSPVETHSTMKQLPLLATFVLAIGGLVPPYLAAQPNASATTPSRGTHATGTIMGRVQNVVTGNYLNKARVTVRGTDLVAYTDEFGSYRLIDVPEGTTTLEVFYTDLDMQEVAVTVTP